jgi:AraC family transcriptional regulator of adaptative response / DNA-3-methyladenine glycosylase II
LTHLVPSAAALAEADLAAIGMPAARREAIRSLASALVRDVAMHPGADSERTRARLLELPGIGPWTVEYTAMRALRDPDAFTATDLGIRHALERLGLPSAARSVRGISEQWRPYRAYAVQHLWGMLEEGAPDHRTPASAAA